jgi:hypothetical protein
LFTAPAVLSTALPPALADEPPDEPPPAEPPPAVEPLPAAEDPPLEAGALDED